MQPRKRIPAVVARSVYQGRLSFGFGGGGGGGEGKKKVGLKVGLLLLLLAAAGYKVWRIQESHVSAENYTPEMQWAPGSAHASSAGGHKDTAAPTASTPAAAAPKKPAAHGHGH